MQRCHIIKAALKSVQFSVNDWPSDSVVDSSVFAFGICCSAYLNQSWCPANYRSVIIIIIIIIISANPCEQDFPGPESVNFKFHEFRWSFLSAFIASSYRITRTVWKVSQRAPVGQVDSIRFKLQHQHIDQLRDGQIRQLCLRYSATHWHDTIVRTKIKLIDSSTRRRLLTTVVHRQLALSEYYPLSVPCRLTSPAQCTRDTTSLLQHKQVVPYSITSVAHKADPFLGSQPARGMFVRAAFSCIVRNCQ